MGESVHDISEQVYPPRKRTNAWYFVLFVIIGPLWSIVPISWIYVIHSLRSGAIFTSQLKGKLLFLAALCEVFFSIYHSYLVYIISRPSPLAPGITTELQDAYARILKAGLRGVNEENFDDESLDEERPGSSADTIEQLSQDDPRAVDFRNTLRNWYGRVPFSSIRVHHAYQWVYWSIFNLPLPRMEHIPPSRLAVLEDTVDLLQKRAGRKLAQGTDSSVRALCLTLDRVTVASRPFAWYAFVGVTNYLVKKLFVHQWNARHGNYNGLEYMVRVPNSWDPVSGPRPIVFVHGLGLGILQYVLLLRHLMHTLADRPLLVPLQPHISQEIFHPRFLKPLTRNETSACLSGLLLQLGWVKSDTDSRTKAQVPNVERGVTMMSHSNGSYTHAWMLKDHPEMIARSCFVDPITFCSWEGDACYNFVYRPPRRGVELIMKYFVGAELGVANLIQRHFDWSANALWYEEIPNARDPSKTLFMLGGKDEIVYSERVKRYLNSHGVRKSLWYDPNGRHGHALMAGGPGHTHVLRWLQQS